MLIFTLLNIRSAKIEVPCINLIIDNTTNNTNLYLIRIYLATSVVKIVNNKSPTLTPRVTPLVNA
jgi:hypothetical protein